MLGLVIDCMGIFFFNDTDHFYYFPELKDLHYVFLEIQESLLMWGEYTPSNHRRVTSTAWAMPMSLESKIMQIW